MKRIKSVLLFAGIASLMMGCAATAHIEKDDSVNFNQYKTFTWLDDSAKSPISGLQVSNLKNAVNAQLAKTNWKEDKDQPDVILKHDILVEKTLKERSNPVYSQPTTRPYYNRFTRRISYIYFPSQFMGYDDQQYVSREGTLTITMIDAKTDKVVWQGWATEPVNNRNLSSKEIQSGVKRIFKNFDPTQQK